MEKRIISIIILFICVIFQMSSHVNAKNSDLFSDSNKVLINSFGDNWYGQLSANMNLQFPYGHNMKDVFPKGKSFGINVAVGKWFTPELGGRLKITWGNGVFKNDYNEWLNPYGKPGENHRTGGYISFLGDIQFNMHNLLGEYKPERTWNLIVSPRAGGWISIGSSDGAPVLGMAVVNTYRLSDKWRLFADVGYHFISSINGPQSEGHGSNGFLDINIGVETELSNNNKFHKLSNNHIRDEKSPLLNSFLDNWFVQVGLGMALFNPYRTNFKDVFPNGSTTGVYVGVGKWFSPQVGLRGGLNWQNGIFENKHAKYLYPEKGAERNNRHGFLSLYADFFFSVHNIVGKYDENRRWNAIVFPRMGMANTFSIIRYEECPVLGIGTEQTYRLNDRIKITTDVVYQVATGGIVNFDYHTDNTGSNGWFDINIGVQYDLGKNTWKKAK